MSGNSFYLKVEKYFLTKKCYEKNITKIILLVYYWYKEIHCTKKQNIFWKVDLLLLGKYYLKNWKYNLKLNINIVIFSENFIIKITLFIG